MPRNFKQSEDLRNVPNPKGRLDVVAYRLAEEFTKGLEVKHGFQGIWDNIETHAQDLIRKGLSGIELPGEAKSLINILAINKDKFLAAPNPNQK